MILIEKLGRDFARVSFMKCLVTKQVKILGNDIMGKNMML
jgi:hypothetical protein